MKRLDQLFAVVLAFMILLSSVQALKEAEDESWSWDDAWCYTKTIGGAAVVGVGVTAAVPFALGAAGFTGTGIAAGSIAAKMMSVSAVANGGGVAAGGTVATLTSMGMTGIGVAAKTVIGGTAGAIYSYFSGGCYKENCD